MGGGKIKRRAVARCQEIVLAVAAAAPDGTYGVNHVLRGKQVTASDLCAAGLATAQRPAFRQQLRPGGSVDGAVDAATAEQRAIRGV